MSGNALVRNIKLYFVPCTSMTTAKSGRRSSTAPTSAATIVFSIALV